MYIYFFDESLRPGATEVDTKYPPQRRATTANIFQFIKCDEVYFDDSTDVEMLKKDEPVGYTSPDYIYCISQKPLDFHS